MSKAKTDRKTFGEDITPVKSDDSFWDPTNEPFLGDDEPQKFKLLKEKMVVLEEENNEKNKLVDKQHKQLDESLRALEEREKKNHELQILIKTMEANLHQLEGERRQYLNKIEDLGRGVANQQDKNSQYEEDLKNLASQLKSRTQENIILNKENKDLTRSNILLRESETLLEEKLRNLERDLSQAEPQRIEAERKYARSLESLRSEVKAKHQEIVQISRELSEVKKSNQDLQRVNENLELELDMLNTTNVSLQKKVEKVALQKSIMEGKLQNRLVRVALAISSLFGFNPEQKAKISASGRR